MHQDLIRSVLDPMLLKANARRSRLRVFLCGPGKLHPFFKAREYIHDYLVSVGGITVTYGEELLARKHGKKGDLQAVESAEAEVSDFTVLLVDSPGSIAELGCFSTSEFLKRRLFAVVPAEYYGSESYLARGPLSILARQFQSSVIYFDRNNLVALRKAVMVPTAMFKFIAGKYRRHYRPYLDRELYKRDPQLYAEYFLRDRREFLEAITLAAIHVANEPTFTELVSILGMSPVELNVALHNLYVSESIKKSAGKYAALRGYSDWRLRQLSSGAISLRKAATLAIHH